MQVNHCTIAESISDGVETGRFMLAQDKLGGNLSTGQVVPGIEVA